MCTNYYPCWYSLRCLLYFLNYCPIDAFNCKMSILSSFIYLLKSCQPNNYRICDKNEIVNNEVN